MEDLPGETDDKTAAALMELMKPYAIGVDKPLF
jgi:hypothetical protein